MSAFVVRPLPFSVVAATQLAVAPASNANLDSPGLTWRAGSLNAYVIIDLGAGSLAYDTIAIVGSNQRPSDTVQIRTGTTSGGTGAFSPPAEAAFTGSKPATYSTVSVFKLSSTRTERYVRLDLTATGHPDGTISVQRIVIGKRVAADGVAANCELMFDDQSVISDGPGYANIDEYPVLPKTKANIPLIKDDVFRTEWIPFLHSVGSSKAFLFVADDLSPANYQTDVFFGRMTAAAPAKHPTYDQWQVEITIRKLAT